MSGRSLQFQQQPLFIPHPSRPPEDRFDRGIDRFNDPESYGMIAVGRDALDMAKEELAQAFHFG